MKKAFTFLLLLNLFPAINLFAELSDTLFISADSIKAGGFYLAEYEGNILWRYHPGDDMKWTSPDFDDSNWELVEPNLNMLKPDAGKWQGIGWFRKVIKIDSSLVNKFVGVYLHQDGASEIFLNGKKIFSFGNVSENKLNEVFFDPNLIPFVFQFDTNKVYTIALRYSNHSHLGREYLYKKFVGHLGFYLSIFDFNSDIEYEFLEHNKVIAFGWGLNGFTLAFSLIFFLLYYFYSKRKLNLYFAFFVFGVFLIGTSFILEIMWYHNLEILALFRLILFLGISLTFIFFLLFIYQTVYKKIIKIFWFFLLAFIIVNLVAFFGSMSILNYTIPLGVIIGIMITESLRVFIIGIKRKVDYVWILSTGAFLFLVFTFLGYLLPEILQTSLFKSERYIFETLNIIVLPIFMAIYLAKSYSKTHNDLEEKIITVQELSEKQIEQERKNAELQLQAELERAENERKTKELDQARKLQLSMLPKDIPTLPNYDIAVYMKTATEVGGDYYDFHISDNNILTAVLGDATGHGLNAGMMVSVTKGLFQNLVVQSDLKNIILQFNSSIISMKLSPMYMSLHFVRITNNQLQVTSAGMPPILYFQNSTKTVQEIESAGPPLGGFPNFNYEMCNYNLAQGDVIILMSDGFAERMNNKKEILGWDKGKELLAEMNGLSADQIIKEFVKASDQWGGERPQDDDITFVVFKVK